MTIAPPCMQGVYMYSHIVLCMEWSRGMRMEAEHENIREWESDLIHLQLSLHLVCHFIEAEGSDLTLTGGGGGGWGGREKKG